MLIPELMLFRRASPLRKLPAVIIFHAFTGRTEFDNDKARQLARVILDILSKFRMLFQLGYVAFAADTYGKGKAASTIDGNFAIMGALLGNR